MRRAGLAWLALLALVCTVRADSPVTSVPTLEIPRLSRAPTLEDFEGMQPPADLAAQMLRVTGFLQRFPVDGAAVSQVTEVYLGYDQQHIYAVFVCFDHEPSKIRARMSARNDFFSDDFVTIQFDTFRDQRRAYVFGSNPLGIQGDAIWVEGVGFDQSFDTVFDTRGKLTGQGYIAWIRVPFKSLRFPKAPRQTWGILLTRDIPRGSEEAFWPQYTLRIEGRLNQMAALEGMENVAPGRNIQLQPYGAFRSTRALDPLAGGFVREPASLDGGLDAKFIFQDRLVLDTTVNPDFSQVESDQPQVTANQRFELFFPEKRPFFLENASYFDTPIQLFFTRRIADPQFGARLTGKIGRTSIGALVADDQSPGRRVPLDDPLAGKRAYFALLRVNRDLYAQSSLGMIYVDREFQGGYNRVGGVDGRLKLNANWVAGFQGVVSSTRRPDGSTVNGPAFDAFLRRSGSHFVYDLNYNDRAPGFRAEAGFIPRTDIRHAAQTVEYWFRPERGKVISWGPRLFAEANWDHEGVLLDWLAVPRLNWNLPRQTSAFVGYAVAGERLRPQDFPGLTQNLYHAVANGVVSFQTSVLPQVSLRAFFWIAGSGTNFVPGPGDLPRLENLSVGDYGVTLRPTRHLLIDNGYLATRLIQRHTGRSIFNNHILRSRWNYQFTPRLSARVILQYETLLANPALTSLETRKNLNADFLVTYLVHPGTAVFVGYNSNHRNIDPLFQPTRNQFLNDGRLFFAKVSYQFRF